MREDRNQNASIIELREILGYEKHVNWSSRFGEFLLLGSLGVIVVDESGKTLHKKSLMWTSAQIGPASEVIASQRTRSGWQVLRRNGDEIGNISIAEDGFHETTLKGADLETDNAIWNPDGNQIALCSGKMSITVHDIHTGVIVWGSETGQNFGPGFTGKLELLGWSDDGKVIAGIIKPNSLAVVFDAKNGTLSRLIQA